MAVNIEALGLPFVPSADTGLYDLPDEQADRIGRYLRALFDAKEAGVLGAAINYPQSYINKVTAQRVTAAVAGGRSWADRLAEMDRDERAWTHSCRRI